MGCVTLDKANRMAPAFQRCLLEKVALQFMSNNSKGIIELIAHGISS